MTAFAQETPGYDPIGAARDKAWQAVGEIAKAESAEAPRKGRRVRIDAGRKAGQEGVVFWHGIDHHSHAGRYGNAMSEALRVARGQYGFRVGIELDNGERGFVAADKVTVIG